jgi:hypothetical protein
MSFAEFLSRFQCPDCGGEVAYRSRRRTLTERYVLPLFLLRPLRCGDCFRRIYRLVTVPARPREEPKPSAHRVAA